MDKMGIDVQAISTSPAQYYYRIEPDLGRQTSRLVNERLAEIVASHPDRFVALGTLPMQDPQLAVAELEYCMKKLGFRGIELGTNVRKAELSDERFNPVWAKAEELGAVIFLHPSGFTDTSRLEASTSSPTSSATRSTRRSRSRTSSSAACSSATRG